MLAQVLRFLDIVLITAILGLIAYSVWISRLKTGLEFDSIKVYGLMAMFLMLGITIGLGDFIITGLDPTTRGIPCSVTITGTVNIDVAWDITGTNPVTSISWGELKPGEKAYTQVYIINKSNAYIWCKINTSSWIPSTAQQYMTLTWDFSAAPLGSQRTRKATFELYILEDITGIDDFSFDIIITADDEPFTG